MASLLPVCRAPFDVAHSIALQFPLRKHPQPYCLCPCVCVVFYLLTRCMRPKGPWQRRFFNLPYPVPNSLRVKPGHPALLLPSQPPCREPSKREIRKQRKEKKGKEEKSRYRSTCTYRRTTSNPPHRLRKLEMTSLRRPRTALFPPIAMVCLLRWPSRSPGRRPTPNPGVP